MLFPGTFSSIFPGVEAYFWKLKWCCILIAGQLFYAPPGTNLEAFPYSRLLNWSLYICVYVKVWKCVAKWRWSYWERKETQPSCINEVGTTVTSAITGTLVNLRRSDGLNQLGWINAFSPSYWRWQTLTEIAN